MSQAALKESFVPTIPLPTPEPEVEEAGSVTMLLRSPQSFVRLVMQDRFDWQQSLILMVTALGLYSLYGLAMGMFAGGNSLWQATIKAPMILIGSAALCAPSLHVLLCMGGKSLRFRQVCAIVAAMAGLSSAIMAAFSPVCWLFGVSTGNLPFMVLLHVIVWGVGLGCGLRLVAQSLPGGIREC